MFFFLYYIYGLHVLLITSLIQARPSLPFNKEGSHKEGSLLAVSTSDNGIKILANADGIELLQMPEIGRLTPESKVTKAALR